MANEGWIISCLVMAVIFFLLFIVFVRRKEKGADLVAGFNSLTEAQKARYDRAAISRRYAAFMRLLGEIFLLGAALAHWLGLWAFIAATAGLLGICATEMHVDWEKAFEKYKINQ